jgi:predicted component of type VI protein secretion system
MFKPAKIESRRGRIPVSEEARREARAGMGGEQTALAAGSPVVPVAPAALVAAEVTQELPAPAAAVASATPVGEGVANPVKAPAVASAEAPARRPRATKVAPAPVAATGPEQEHSVKLSRSVVQQIKLTLALLPSAPGNDNPANIKQYLEMAHRLLDAQLRKAGKLPPV